MAHKVTAGKISKLKSADNAKVKLPGKIKGMSIGKKTLLKKA